MLRQQIGWIGGVFNGGGVLHACAGTPMQMATMQQWLTLTASERRSSSTGSEQQNSVATRNTRDIVDRSGANGRVNAVEAPPGRIQRLLRLHAEVHHVRQHLRRSSPAEMITIHAHRKLLHSFAALAPPAARSLVHHVGKHLHSGM